MPARHHSHVVGNEHGQRVAGGGQRALRVLAIAAAAYLCVLLAGFYFDLGEVGRHQVESAAFVFVGLGVATVCFRGARPTVADDPEPRQIHLAGMTALFAALALILYGPTIGLGLFADDFVILAAAREGRFTVWTELFRPVVFVVWRLLDHLPGPVDRTLHLLNIVLHVANAVWLTVLARRLGLGLWAGVAGLLFVTFPASVEPVAWPAGVQDVLAATLTLVWLLAVTARKGARAVAGAGLLALALAFATKESAIAAAPLALLVGLAAGRSRCRWRLAWIGVGLAAALLAVRLLLLPLPDRLTGAPTRYEAKEFLVRSFATLVVPLRDVEVRAVPALALGGAVLTIGLLTIGFSRWRRHDSRFRLSVAMAAFVLTAMAATNRLLFVDGDLLGSRYLYLASAGWAVLLAGLLQEAAAFGRRTASAVAVSVMAVSVMAVSVMAVSVMIVAWCALTILHVQPWIDAAETRSRLLDNLQARWTDDCTTLRVSGLPEVVAGVPVFLNGFSEAVRQRLTVERVEVAGESADVACRFHWDGADWQRR